MQIETASERAEAGTGIEFPKMQEIDEGNPKPELVPGGLSGTTGDAQKFQAIAAEVMPDDGVGTAAIAAAPQLSA